MVIYDHVGKLLHKVAFFRPRARCLSVDVAPFFRVTFPSSPTASIGATTASSSS